MKKSVLLILLISGFLATIASASGFVDTEDLEQYFIDNNIDYEKFSNRSFSSTSSDTGQFLDFPDPADDETIGVFFELHTKSALSAVPNGHWAILLRGTHGNNGATLHRGRGLALGNFSSFQGCSGKGGLLEDFTLNTNPNGIPVTHPLYASTSEWVLTQCQPISIQNNAIYRVDVHVSKQNVYAEIWRKVFVYDPYLGFYADYYPVKFLSCVLDPDENGVKKTCKETLASDGVKEVKNIGGNFVEVGSNLDDSGIGNAFIGFTGNASWSMKEVFVAVFPSYTGG